MFEAAATTVTNTQSDAIGNKPQVREVSRPIPCGRGGTPRRDKLSFEIDMGKNNRDHPGPAANERMPIQSWSWANG